MVIKLWHTYLDQSVWFVVAVAVCQLSFYFIIDFWCKFYIFNRKLKETIMEKLPIQHGGTMTISMNISGRSWWQITLDLVYVLGLILNIITGHLLALSCIGLWKKGHHFFDVPIRKKGSVIVLVPLYFILLLCVFFVIFLKKMIRLGKALSLSIGHSFTCTEAFIVCGFF